MIVAVRANGEETTTQAAPPILLLLLLLCVRTVRSKQVVLRGLHLSKSRAVRREILLEYYVCGIAISAEAWKTDSTETLIPTCNLNFSIQYVQYTAVIELCEGPYNIGAGRRILPSTLDLQFIAGSFSEQLATS